MPVCKFFLSGNCKFGDGCRFEHPGAGNQHAQNNFSQGRGGLQQPRNQGQRNPPSSGSRNAPNQNRFNSLESRIETPSGPRGNARFGGNYVPPAQGQNQQAPSQRGRGFQGHQGGQRGAFRPNQYVSPSRSQRSNLQQTGNRYDLKVETLVEELRERPQWPLTCFGPGINPPINLWGGEVEQSPEELRFVHYLDMEQGIPSRSAQLEYEGAAQANQYVNSALEDPAGAIEYIVRGESQPDNRHAVTKFQRHKFPLFSRDNYEKRRGVFEHIPRDRPNQNQGRFSAQSGARNGPQGSAFGQQNAGFGQSQPTAFGQPQNNSFGGGAIGQQGQSPFGQIQQPTGFGSFAQPNGGVGQVQEVQMDAMGNAPTGNTFGQPAQLSHMGQSSNMNTFGQNNAAPSAFGQNNATASSFGQPAQPGNTFGSNQNGGAFGAPQQLQSPPAQQGVFNSLQQPPFGSQQQNPSPGGFGSQANGFGTQPPQTGGFGQQPSNGFGAGVTQNMNNGIGGGQMAGSAMGAAGPPLESGSEREAAWLHYRQTGQFKDGMLPEIAPPEDFIS